MRVSRTVGTYFFGAGTLARLEERIAPRLRQRPGRPGSGRVVFFVDHFFTGRDLVAGLPARAGDRVVMVDTTHEPSTDQVDGYCAELEVFADPPTVIVGIGGGATLDVAKAVANLATNGGKAADYQGWDLVREPAVYKIGVPTLSGTGAEASATCVMMNYKKNLKLGMNSVHTVYDELILDPDLSATVPADQYFYTGQDTYIHCIESLAGSYRHALADAYSREALALSRSVFLSDDMRSPENREKMMVASYLGGSAIGNSFVGLVHPFSAGLSVVLGTHHCLANCIVMTAMAEFYPREVAEFQDMLAKQGVSLPSGLCRSLSDEDFDRLYRSTIIHEKPLRNALGDDFAATLTRDKVAELFLKM